MTNENTAEAGNADASITIKGLSFSVPQPYSEGHVLTVGEASALNQTYGENIRNNFAGQVEKLLGEGVKVATPEQKAELESKLADYIADYEFGVKKSRTPKIGADEKEARKRAKEIILTAFRTQNIDPKSQPEGHIDSMVLQLLDAKPNIREEAAAYVAKLQSDAVDALAGLTVVHATPVAA